MRREGEGRGGHMAKGGAIRLVFGIMLLFCYVHFREDKYP